MTDGRRTYVEELEKRIERMQEQLESMTRSGIGIQRGVENTRRSRSSSPGQSVESTTDYREPEDPADGDNIPGMPQVPPDKGLHPSAENDQSIVIDSQDGKMRYFGRLRYRRLIYVQIIDHILFDLRGFVCLFCTDRCQSKWARDPATYRKLATRGSKKCSSMATFKLDPPCSSRWPGTAHFRTSAM